jgi:hypothetical protein
VKLTLTGVAASCAELTPVPDIATVTVVELDAELFLPPELWAVIRMETLPLSVPVDGGVNVMLPMTLCPPASVIG